ncbi:T9SS type A sorting domain-containing protein [Bacteroidia bacterium]|nr:T9SS type A sorting domain-containing protein [Bacteroidia bacterium]
MKKIFTLILSAISLIGFAQAPTTSAAAPTEADADVISVFSDGFTDLAGTNFNPAWGQATVYSAFDVSGDNMLKYATLNYQGIEFGSDINAASKGTLHMDIWSEQTADVAIFCISRGAVTEKSVTRTLIAGQWNSVDISLSDYTAQGLSVSDLFQFKFDETARTISPSIYVDNIYFYGTATATEPVLAAPTPNHPAANVTSIYSQSYTDPAAANYFPGWGQSTQIAEFVLGTDTMIEYSNLNYQGITFEETIDLSAREFMHMDVWTSSVDSLLVFPISKGSGERSVKAGLSQSSWTSIDIPVSAFTDQGLDMSDIHQLKLEDPDGKSGTIYLDNIYFYSVPVPMAAAATPTQKEEDVISVYSQSYADLAAPNLYPGWGQSTKIADFVIGTDTMIEYSNLNYQGIEFGETIDATGMDTLHLDVWSTDVSNLEVYPISVASGEKQVTIALTANSWNNIDIPLADYTAQSLDMSDIIQLKLVDPDGNNGTIYLDNVYFYKAATASVSAISFNSLKVYPNPANEKLTIAASTNGVNINTISLINIQGQTLNTQEVNSTVANSSINVSNLPSGVYFVQVSTEQGTHTERVIIK